MCGGVLEGWLVWWGFRRVACVVVILEGGWCGGHRRRSGHCSWGEHRRWDGRCGDDDVGDSFMILMIDGVIRCDSLPLVSMALLSIEACRPYLCEPPTCKQTMPDIILPPMQAMPDIVIPLM